MISGQGEMETNEHGAKRESNKGRGRFDLLPWEAMLAYAIWSEDGAEKYGDRNWEAGLSVKDCVNRLLRHAIKAANGWTDEDHLAACMWNAGAAITMMERKPECNDHVWHKEELNIDGTDEYSPLENESGQGRYSDWRRANPGIPILWDHDASKKMAGPIRRCWISTIVSRQ